MENKKILLRKRINKELNNISYNSKYKGTMYLEETIFIIYIKGMKNIKNLQKNIYPIVGKKYRTSINNVKSNIRRASERMYYDCCEKVLRDFLKDDFDCQKPKTKEIIRAIIRNVGRI